MQFLQRMFNLAVQEPFLTVAWALVGAALVLLISGALALF